MFIYHPDDRMSQVKDHVDNFNCIILDLQGVNVKSIDDNQALILLCSLANSYYNLLIPCCIVEQRLLSKT